MTSQIASGTLIMSVGNWLREQAFPALSGADRFNARVAANAMDLVARELALGQAAAAREEERLRILLGCDGDLQTLRRELEMRIRTSAMTMDTQGLLHHLRETTLDQLSIDQPGYSAYKRAP